MVDHSSLQKSRIWPIRPDEMKLFWLMSAFLMCLSLNYVIIHDIKDTLVVGHVGPSFVAFLKFWVTIPGAILFFLTYAKLSAHLPQKFLLYGILLLYALYFFVFAFYMYPDVGLSCEKSSVPDVRSSLDDLFIHWRIVIFYLAGELWGNVVLGLLFWGFANRLIRLSVAKRFYVPLNLSTAIATIAGGLLNSFISSGLRSHSLDYMVTIKILSVILIFSIILGIFFYQRIISSSDQFSQMTQKHTEKMDESQKTSFLMSIRTIFASPYLFRIAVMVMCFGFVYNFVEIIWKYELRQVFSKMNEYSSFLGLITVLQSIVSFLVIIMGSGFTVKFGWRKAALVTPAALMITAVLFFSCVLIKRESTLLTGFHWISMMPVYLGALHFITARTCRLAFFEPGKDMLFIPLSGSLRTQGKSAVDVVGDRLGKGGGSLIQHSMIAAIGSIAGFVPYAFALSLCFLGIWFYSTISISSLFLKQSATQDKE
ncbi:MAG: hypothetical protein H6618_03725 [Deltaproteobacteria bacterium]|nr:hypothetical protein [Deltaproteobacteria bacterium]